MVIPYQRFREEFSEGHATYRCEGFNLSAIFHSKMSDPSFSRACYKVVYKWTFYFNYYWSISGNRTYFIDFSEGITQFVNELCNLRGGEFD